MFQLVAKWRFLKEPCSTMPVLPAGSTHVVDTKVSRKETETKLPVFRSPAKSEKNF